MFQIVRLTLDDSDNVIVRRPLQPLFELLDDAMAMAEFDASRLWGDYGRDEEQDCWWATELARQKISVRRRAGHGRRRRGVSLTLPVAGSPATAELPLHIP